MQKFKKSALFGVILIIYILLCICIFLCKIKFNCLAESQNDFFVANVVNPNIKSEVYLTYNDYSDSKLYKTNIKIVVKTDGNIIEIPTNNLGGYDPKLFLGDFLGNGLDQIMLTVQSGGSGGYSFVYIYSVADEIVKEIFNFQKFNDQVTFKTEVINNTAKIISNQNNVMLLDIANKEKSDMETYVSSVNTIFPFYNTFFNKYYLMLLNKVIGGYEANNYGYVINLAKLDGSENYIILNQGVLNNFSEV